MARATTAAAALGHYAAALLSALLLLAAHTRAAAPPPPAAGTTAAGDAAAGAVTAAANFFRDNISGRLLCAAQMVTRIDDGKTEAVYSFMSKWSAPIAEGPLDFSITDTRVNQQTNYKLGKDGKRVLPGTVNNTVIRLCFQFGARRSAGRVVGTQFPCDAKGAPADTLPTPWVPGGVLITGAGPKGLAMRSTQATPFTLLYGPDGSLQPRQLDVSQTFTPADAPGGPGFKVHNTAYFYDPAAIKRLGVSSESGQSFGPCPGGGGEAADFEKAVAAAAAAPAPGKWEPAEASKEYDYLAKYVMGRDFESPETKFKIESQNVVASSSTKRIFSGLTRTRGGFYYTAQKESRQVNQDLGPDGKPTGKPRVEISAGIERCQYSVLAPGVAAGLCYPADANGAPKAPQASASASATHFAWSPYSSVLKVSASDPTKMTEYYSSTWPYRDLFATGGGVRAGREAVDITFSALPDGRVTRTRVTKGYEVDPVTLSEKKTDELPARVEIAPAPPAAGK